MSGWHHGHCRCCCEDAPCPSTLRCDQLDPPDPPTDPIVYTPTHFHVFLDNQGLLCCVGPDTFGSYLKLTDPILPIEFCCVQTGPCEWMGRLRLTGWGNFADSDCQTYNGYNNNTQCGLACRIWHTGNDWRLEIWDPSPLPGVVARILFRAVIPRPCKTRVVANQLTAMCNDSVADPVWQAGVVAMTGGNVVISRCCTPNCCPGVVAPPKLAITQVSGLTLCNPPTCFDCNGSVVSWQIEALTNPSAEMSAFRSFSTASCLYNASIQIGGSSYTERVWQNTTMCTGNSSTTSGGWRPTFRLTGSGPYTLEVRIYVGSIFNFCEEDAQGWISIGSIIFMGSAVVDSCEFQDVEVVNDIGIGDGCVAGIALQLFPLTDENPSGYRRWFFPAAEGGSVLVSTRIPCEAL